MAYEYEVAYQKVTALKKKHPDLSTKALIEKAGVSANRYYVGARHAAGVKAAAPKKTRAPRKPRYEQLQPEPQATGRIPVMFCTKAELREFFQ